MTDWTSPEWTEADHQATEPKPMTDNLKYVQDLCGSKHIGWICSQLVADLDRKDRCIEELQTQIKNVRKLGEQATDKTKQDEILRGQRGWKKTYTEGMIAGFEELGKRILASLKPHKQ